MMPAVGVAITTYNQARYIGETIESVLRQSTAPAEIVVIDDGSTDDTPWILERFRPHIRIIRQRNGGVAIARNTAVQACSADFVALLDGDDLWHPHKIRRSLQLIERFQPVSLLAHDIDCVSDGGATLRRGQVGVQLRRVTEQDAALVDCLAPLLECNFIWTTSQVVIKRNDYLSVGMSDPRFPVASDFDLYLRLALRSPFLLSREVLASWREHDDSASGSGWERHVNWAIGVVCVLKKARRSGLFDTPVLEQRETAARRELARDIYRREPTLGRWTTARLLARVAAQCGDPRSAVTGACVLAAPEWMRRLAAAATGISVSTSSADE
jgi:glycosyltransferase involved in cell wall biosynthesis